MYLFLSGIILLLENIRLKKLVYFLEVEGINSILEILEILKSIIENFLFFVELRNIFKVDY